MKTDPDPAPHPSAAPAGGTSKPAPVDTRPSTGATVPKGTRDAEAPQAKPLTKDEQMALYEEALKENDWGHQPC
jgi:hypothetical protein